MTRVDLVDPPAYSPAYDDGLAAALARAGAQVRLVTSRFDYTQPPQSEGYQRSEYFYRRARGAPGTPLRTATRLATHVPDMLGYRRLAREADIVHAQWLLIPGLDLRLLPNHAPLVLTVHDPLSRWPLPGPLKVDGELIRRRTAAVIVHTEYGRRTLLEQYGLEPERVHVIRIGATTSVPALAHNALLPPELSSRARGPVVLCFGLVRPYKGIEVLLEAWEGIDDAELWIVGRPMMDMTPLRARASGGVRFLSRYVSSTEEAALFRRADLVVLPYEQGERFGFSAVLATALAFGKATVISDIGGFAEVAALGAAAAVRPGDPAALRQSMQALLADPAARVALGAAALAAANGPFSWDAAARQTLDLYTSLL